MDPRFITKDIHALLDYPVALMLMTAPFLLGLGESHPFALWLGVGTGVAALVLTLLTDHKLGVVRVLPYMLHVPVVPGMLAACLVGQPVTTIYGIHTTQRTTETR